MDNKELSKEIEAIKPKAGEQKAKIAACLQKSLRQLVEKANSANSVDIESLTGTSVKISGIETDTIVDLLELPRDLDESRVLVIDDGSGILPKALAEKANADVVAIELSKELVESAKKLNGYPSLVIKEATELLTDEDFDLIVDCGVLSLFSREVLNGLLKHLASHCRRKMIVCFYLEISWQDRFFSKVPRFRNECQKLYKTTYQNGDSVALIETACSMVVSERKSVGSSILLKAIKKAYPV